MTTTCPACSSNSTVVLETRRLKGGIRRRHLCRECEHRWSIVGPDDGLPRQRTSCHGCQHWKGRRCGFEFPDPLEEGPKFAIDCLLYKPL